MKILYLLSRIPYPIDKGDKLRAYHQIKHLSKNNELAIFALNDESSKNIDLSEINKLCSTVQIERLSKIKVVSNLLKGINKDLPLQTSYFYNSSISKKLNEFITEFSPDVIVCQLIRMAHYLNDIHNYPIVLDYIDVLSKGLQRRSNSASLILKPILKREYKKVIKYESTVFENFMNAIIITPNDRDALNFARKNEVAVFPNGVDFNSFSSKYSKKKWDLIFAGNMGYPPNIDAAVFLTQKVLPILRKYKPDVSLCIVGASPDNRIKRLEGKFIEVTGWVEDIREYYDKSRVFAAPMQIGTGLQNKILEAMSMKLPCVISSLAQGGICGENRKNLFVADDPVKIAELIYKLLNDRDLRESIGKEARKFVVNNYNWETIGMNFEKYLIDVVRK